MNDVQKRLGIIISNNAQALAILASTQADLNRLVMEIEAGNDARARAEVKPPTLPKPTKKGATPP